MDRPDPAHIADDVAAAQAAVVEAEKRLREARQAYLRSLEANDRIGQVAFLLYQQAVQREPDWEGPVTWEHWHDLQIEEERDDWRELAVQILSLIDGRIALEDTVSSSDQDGA